jgi:hypothetical protein
MVRSVVTFFQIFLMGKITILGRTKVTKSELKNTVGGGREEFGYHQILQHCDRCVTRSMFLFFKNPLN